MALILKSKPKFFKRSLNFEAKAETGTLIYSRSQSYRKNLV